MTQTVRVYADGRLCIPVGVLNQFRVMSKGSMSSVWISLFDNQEGRSVLLTWNRPEGTGIKSSKEYDLSVRDRVLFKAPDGINPFKPGQLFKVHVNAVAISVSVTKARDTPKKRKARPIKATKRKPKPIRSLTLEAQFEAQFRVKLCEILASPEYADITIEQLAKVMPDLTVREIVSA